MTISRLFALAIVCCIALTGCTPTKSTSATGADQLTAYIGAYTRDEGWVHGKSDGIRQLTFDPKTGAITGEKLIREMTNPSFVVESNDGRYLYAISEMARAGEPSGSIVALDIADNYRLVSELPTDGKASCHVQSDATGTVLMTTNYSGGVAKVFMRQADGTLRATDKFSVPEGLVPGKVPHLHSTYFSPDNRIAAIADLGLDRVWLFNLDVANGKITPHKQPYVQLAEGAGPRHSVWSANGRFLYVINELNATINVLDYSATADHFKIGQTVATLPDGYTGKNSCSHIALHPSGKFLYGANRGHNSIVGYKVDENTGRLTLVGHQPTEGDFPRNFAISPNGKFLYAANQNTGNISIHTVNTKSGKLTFTGQTYEVPTPVCIEF